MKAFLMYRDRDFDADHLLVRRERELHHSRAYRRGPGDNSLDLAQALPWNQGELRQDLGLDILFEAMSGGDAVLSDVAQVAILSSLTDLSDIRYRQDALTDTFRHPATVREIYRISVEAIEGERKNYWTSINRYPAGTLHHAVEVVQGFVVMLKKLRNIADRSVDQFTSEGFSRFFAMLRAELSDEYFAVIDGHLARLKFRRGTLVSAQLGRGNKGVNYVLRKPREDKRSWLAHLLGDRPPGYTFELHPRDESGVRALSALNDRGVNLVANALAQSTDHILSFFQMLRTEIAFYVGCLNLRKRLSQLDEPICIPVLTPVGSRALSYSELYDGSLALSMKRKIVANSFNADGKSLILITGANTGGKSTFLRSLGIATLMSQAGMFVCAHRFMSEVHNGVASHYKREEDTNMESGKWDEELNRMSGIIERIKPDSLVLFNESFASTNEREGSEIAGQIVKALLDAGMTVFFVTHLYHFALSFFDRRDVSAAFLRAERKPDGSRPYRLVEGAPLETSYGEDLYKEIFGRDGPPGRIAASASDAPIRTRDVRP